MHADERQAACRPCNEVAESISTSAALKEFLFVFGDQLNVILYEFLWHTRFRCRFHWHDTRRACLSGHRRISVLKQHHFVTSPTRSTYKANPRLEHSGDM